MPLFFLTLFNPITAFLQPALTFWALIPKPVKVLIYLIIAALIGFVYGRHVARVECEAQKQESINIAKQIDVKANQDAVNSLMFDKEKYRKQSLDFENKYNAAVAGYTTLKEECVDAKFIEDNNKLNDDLGADLSRGVPNKVPGSKPGLAPNSKRGPVSHELQKGPSK